MAHVDADNALALDDDLGGDALLPSITQHDAQPPASQHISNTSGEDEIKSIIRGHGHE